MNPRGELFFIKQLGLRLLSLIGVWMICRIGFYAFNASSFPIDSSWELVKLLFFGIRFDLVSIAYVNILLALSYFIPFSFRKNLTYQKIQKWIFIIFNSIALIFEIGDMGYFQFAFRRAIGNDLQLIGETTNMTFLFLIDFWYLVLIWVGMVAVLNFIYKKTTLQLVDIKTTTWKQWLIFPIVIGLYIVAMRGGFQLRPVMSLTAAQYVDDMRLMPLQTNTTLNLLFSAQQNLIEEKNYMSQEEQDRLFPILKNPSPQGEFKKENVFIIVLESFGKEHIGFFNDYERSPTPFIDSLMTESWYFENAYAVGTRSTEGISAISASLPRLMEDALMFSAYQGNRVDGIAAHLTKKGYTSGFFHGSNPGSMEFERFSKMTGYQNFYDRTHYPDQTDYDGNWGIWDNPFFQFTLGEVDKYPKPFTALLFSLTSHHPYNVEEFFKKNHPDESDQFQAIRYTDFALRQFFDSAKKMDWYENTLFVITADHIGKWGDRKYKTVVGKYQIPLLFFKPNSDLKGAYSKVIQQTDVMPTILEYLNYDEPYISFGKSAYDTLTSRYAYMYSGGFHQIITDSLCLSVDNENRIGNYNYRKDPLLKNDILHQNKNVDVLLEKQLRAAVQAHHNAMIKNELVIHH